MLSQDVDLRPLDRTPIFSYAIDIYSKYLNDKNDNINIFVDIKESGEYKRLDEESSKNIVIKFNNEILESLKK